MPPRWDGVCSYRATVHSIRLRSFFRKSPSQIHSVSWRNPFAGSGFSRTGFQPSKRQEGAGGAPSLWPEIVCSAVSPSDLPNRHRGQRNPAEKQTEQPDKWQLTSRLGQCCRSRRRCGWCRSSCFWCCGDQHRHIRIGGRRRRRGRSCPLQLLSDHRFGDFGHFLRRNLHAFL